MIGMGDRCRETRRGVNDGRYNLSLTFEGLDNAAVQLGGGTGAST